MSGPDLDVLYDQLLNLPSNLTLAHELLDLIKYARSLEEQLETVQRVVLWAEAGDMSKSWKARAEEAEMENARLWEAMVDYARLLGVCTCADPLCPAHGDDPSTTVADWNEDVL